MSSANNSPGISTTDPTLVGQDLIESDRVPDSADLQGEEKLFFVLLNGGTATAAAKASGLSQTTVYRRLRDPRFRRKLEEGRATVRDSIVQRLTDAAGGAVDCLWELTEHEEASVRLQASKALLDGLAKVQDVMLRHSDKVRETCRLEQDQDQGQRQVVTKEVTKTVPS